MTRWLLVSTSILLLLTLSSTAAQHPQLTASQARIELTAVLAERNAALERGDEERVRAFYAPNFMLRAGNGRTVTLQELEQLSKIAERPSVLERKYTSEIQLAIKLETGFPKGRGKLRIDTTVLGAQVYKLPKLLELNPLGNDNIDDPSRVITDNR